MKMNTKNKFFIFAIVLISLFFVFVGKSFLSAQLTEINEISSDEYSYQGENVEIQGEIMRCKEGFENCKIQVTPKGGEAINLELTQGANYNPISGRISLAESGASFKIGDETFSNIKSGDLVLDQKTGAIKQAKFTTTTEGGNYNINGNQFKVPGDKEFIYPSENGGYKLPDGVEIVKVQPNTRLESEGIFNYDGNKLSGKLNFDNSGNAFLKINEKVEINGVLIENSGNNLYGSEANLPIFFDKAAVENYEKINIKKAYVVIDKEKGFFAFQEQMGKGFADHRVKMEFTKASFIGDLMDEKDFIGINQGSNNADGGYLEISRLDLDSAIIVKNKGAGEIVLENGMRNFNIYGRGISISRTSREKIGTVPLVIETDDVQIKDEEGDLVGKREGIAGWVIEDKEFNKPKILWMEKKTSGELVIEGAGYISGEEEISDNLAKKFEKGVYVSQTDLDQVSKIINDPKFKTYLKKSKTADKELKGIYNNGQIGLKEVIQKNPQGISFNDLKKEIGPENAQRIKDGVKNKIRIYYDYYNPSDRDKQLQKVLGVNEFNSFKNCISSGGSFDSEYIFYGPKTERCIIDPTFCPIINAVKLYSTSS